MNNKKLSNLALLIATAIISGCSQSEEIKPLDKVDTSSYQQPGGVMFFFEQGVPDTVAASSDSELSLSQSHFKDGKTSLAWAYKAGSSLTFSQHVGYRPFVANDTDQSQSTFSAWIYNPQAKDAQLTFEFGTNGEAQVSFAINMDFKGWRHLLIPFKDMEGNPADTMDFMQVSTPKGIEPGEIFLDQVMLSIPADPR